MAARRQLQRKPEKLPEYEWNFSSCPEELIWDCWLFEYSREHVKLGGDLPCSMADYFTRNMQFPRTPFLNLHEIGRTPLPSDTDLDTDKGNRKTLDKELKSLAKYFFVWEDCNGVHATGKRVNWNDVWKIKIDWTLSDTKLTREFSQFIREIRRGEADEKRGKNPRSARSAELKKLGAFRLLEAGYTVNDAINYTRKISGVGLFSCAPDWSDAKKEAKRLLSEWPPKYLCPPPIC